MKIFNQPLRNYSSPFSEAYECWWANFVFLKKNKSTEKLSNIKHSESPQRTIKVDDNRIIFFMKSNLSTTFSHIISTLKEVGVSLSKSTIKGYLYECKYREFTPMCNH